MKLRYVPSSLPDMLGLSDDPVVAEEARGAQAENVLGGFRLGEIRAPLDDYLREARHRGDRFVETSLTAALNLA